MILKAASLVLLVTALASCAPGLRATHVPTAADVENAETLRILTPLASPTKTGGQMIVEFGPKVETRNAACQPAGDAFECRYESRVTAFFDQPTDNWTERRAVIVRANGQWRMVQ